MLRLVVVSIHIGAGAFASSIRPRPHFIYMRTAATVDNTGSKNPLQFVQVADALMSVLIRELSPSEFKVLSFLIHRTVFWGRDRTWVSIADIHNGVIGKYYAKLNSGTGLSQGAIRKAIQGLSDYGYVSLTCDSCGRRSKQYKVNVDKIMLRKPKRLQEKGAVAKFANEQDEDKATKNDTQGTPLGSKKCSLHIIEHSSIGKLKGKEGKLKGGRTPRGGRSVEDARAKAKAVKKRYREKHLPLLEERKVRFKDLEILWGGLIKAAYPELARMPLTGKARHAMFQKQKKFVGMADELEDTETFPRFMQWAVDAWTTIRDTQFAWMSNYPPYPDPWFFIRWMDDFAMFYMSRKAKNKLQGAGDDELVTKLVRVQGISYEDAEGIVQRRAAIHRHEQQLNEALSRVHTAEISLEGAITRAERRKALTAAHSARKEAQRVRVKIQQDVEAFEPEKLEFEQYD